MSDMSEIADLLLKVASVRDRLRRRVFLRVVSMAKIAVACIVLDEAERGVDLRRGEGSVVPFTRRPGSDRPGGGA